MAARRTKKAPVKEQTKDITSASTEQIAELPKIARTKKPKIVMYVSKKVLLVHPDQNVRFYPGTPVHCAEDTWLEAQMVAGLISKVE